MDSIFDEVLVTIDYEQMRCAPVVDFHDRVMHLPKSTTVR